LALSVIQHHNYEAIPVSKRKGTITTVIFVSEGLYVKENKSQVTVIKSKQMTKIKSEKRAGYITSVPSNIHGVQREPL
jgi:hypothetical protein